MISYAQNYEDVILRRAVGERASGFYVDIGAADPVVNSVTNHFYARGWSGINVEPEPGAFARLVAARPRDINLNLAIASQPGRLPLRVIAIEPELSTIHPMVAQRYSGVLESSTFEVVAERLDDVLNRYATRPIDFLKIDVEGAEADALASVDLERWAPAVLIVEATQPGSPIPSHHAWEPAVVSGGYELALFDGVNRFYARAADRRTLAALRVPANWFDHFIQYRWWVTLTPEARHHLLAEGYRDPPAEPS